MADVHELKVEFEKARQELINEFFGSGIDCRADVINNALQRMHRAFYHLLLSTFEDIGRLPANDHQPTAWEILCAYAVNASDSWIESQWQVVLINGQPVPDPHKPPSVREFTRQKIIEGWRTVSLPHNMASNTLFTPDGQPIYELFFVRKHTQDSRTDLPGVPIPDKPPNNLDKRVN